MRISTLFIACLIGLSAFAQNSSLTVFNNAGQPFFVIMNGIRQNSIPQTNVKVGGMSLGSYEIKLIFADGKTGDINKKIYLGEPGDYLGRVVINGTKRKLQYFGMTSTSNPAPAGGTNIVYRPNDQATYSDQVQIAPPTSVIYPTTNPTNNGSVNGAFPNGGNGQTTTTTTQTTTQSTTSGTTNPTNGVGGININVNVSDPATTNGTFGTSTVVKDPVTGQVINMGTSMNGTSTSTQTTTTTTTTSTTVVNGGTVNQQQPIYNQGNIQQVNNNSQVFNSGVCNTVLTNVDAFVARLKAVSFDNDRVEMIQAEFAQKCLSSQQAYAIIKTLTFDSDRLEQAKFLYLKMTDKTNGGVLVDLLTFDNDKKEYSKFMSANR